MSSRKLSGAAVLVIDDDVDASDLACTVLVLAGAVVTHASSAREAMALLPKATFDAVLCDIAMPEVDGLEFVRWLRSLDSHADLPAVAFSAFCTAADRGEALQAGFDRHVPKLGDTRAVITALDEVIVAHRRRGLPARPITTSGTYGVGSITANDSDPMGELGQSTKRAP